MIQTQKKNMVIVCCDEQYLKSIEYHLAKALCNKVELSFITNRACLQEFNQSPNDIDILFIEQELYQEVISRQNCKQVFVLVDHDVLTQDQKNQGHITPVYKYSSVRSMIDQLDHSLLLDKQQSLHESTKIISVYSPNGGCGKTTVSLGLASVLGKKGYKTLFISTDMEQDYQFFLGEHTLMPDQIGYQCKLQPQQAVEELLLQAKKREFVYFPAWKRVLPAYGIDTTHLLLMIDLLQKKNIYDYIVVELTSQIQEEKLNFLNQSDRVVLVSKQDKLSAHRLQKFLENIVEWKGQTVIVNTFYEEDGKNYLGAFRDNMKYTICEQIEELSQESILQEIQERHVLEKTATAVL